MVSDCLVCREVAGELELPGGVLWEDENAIAFHIPGPVFSNAPGKPEAEIAASVGGSDDRGADGSSGVALPQLISPLDRAAVAPLTSMSAATAGMTRPRHMSRSIANSRK